MISSIARMVYRVGLQVRNSEILQKYAFLKESENWSRDHLLRFQFEQLRALLASSQRSPFYQSLYRKHGVDVRDVKHLADLGRLPVISKSNLLENHEQIQVPGFEGQLFRSETSGSTGHPLLFYRDKSWDAWVNASVFRGLSWHGVDPWEHNGYLWGFNIAGSRRLRVRLEDALQNRFRLFSYDRVEMRDFIQRLKNAAFLSGYSSMIYELAKLANEEGISLSNLRFVKGTSEKIHESYQQEAVRAFGRRITSEYGAAEGGIIAFECRFGKMHINMETVIVEEQDSEIILTNLVSRSFPVIRYALGDNIVLNRGETCPCGLSHDVLGDVAGRTGTRIRGMSRDFPSLTLYYVFKNLALDHHVVVGYSTLQDSPGVLKVKLDKTISEKEEALLRREFKKYFSDEIRIEIGIEPERSEVRSKRRDFVSLLDESDPA